MDPISVLIWILVIAVVLWLLWLLLGVMEMPSQLRTVLIVAAAALCLWWLAMKAGLTL